MNNYTYRIITAIKKNTTRTIAVVSFLFSVLVAIINIIAYIIEVRVLSFWNVSSSYLTIVPKSVLYSICFGVALIIIHVTICTIMEWEVEIEAYYGYHKKKYKNNNYDERRKKRIRKLLISINIINLIRNMSFLLLCFMILMVFSIAANASIKRPEQNILIEALIESGILTFIYSIILFLFKMKAFKNLKRTKKPQHYRMISKKVLSDSFIKNSIESIVIIVTALFFVLLINADYLCKNQKDFYVSSINGSTYAMIYDNGNKTIFVNADYSESQIILNPNKQYVSQGSYDLDYIKFEKVDIIRNDYFDARE